MLFRVADEGVEPVASTTLRGEERFEQDLERWVEQRPEILGEPLLLIGRQVSLDEGRDRIDLLALDASGSLVVIELKRDLVGRSADLQAVRYAALLSTWEFEQIARQAEGYWESTNANRATLAQEIADFCDEGETINGRQRIILVGREMSPRLGTVATWLRDHGVDIRVVTVQLFSHGDDLLLQPQVVLPVPREARPAPVTGGDPRQPWRADGLRWHLERRCSATTRPIAEEIIRSVESVAPELVGPDWSSKNYVSWAAPTSGLTMLRLITGPRRLRLDVRAPEVDESAVAERLGWAQFEGEADLADKLALGSSVGRRRVWLRLIIKDYNDIGGDASPQFAGVVRDLLGESSDS